MWDPRTRTREFRVVRSFTCFSRRHARACSGGAVASRAAIAEIARDDVDRFGSRLRGARPLHQRLHVRTATGDIVT